jgi:Putative DNA-binding domain
VPTAAELQPLVTEPREDIGVEYKEWLDPTSNHGRATIARAAIALANHGGGFIVIGFAEKREALVSQTKPDNLPAITQDGANAAVRRYADPEFHVEVYRVAQRHQYKRQRAEECLKSFKHVSVPCCVSVSIIAFRRWTIQSVGDCAPTPSIFGGLESRT